MAATSYSAPSKGKAHIPIVHESRAVTGDGMLTQRQKTWMYGPSNDIYLENPILYKHILEEKAKKDAKSVSYKESIKIRGLISDNEDPAKHSWGIVEKIQGSRKERHEAAMEEMIQELAGISLDLEPQIEEICTTIKDYLTQDSQEIDQTMMNIMKDEELIIYSLDDLHKMWQSIEQHSSKRTQWIHQLHQHLDEIEQKRSALICEVLKSYTQTLERIAHLMPGDVHRLMEDEIMTINSSIIKNQQASSDLVKRLLIADIENEKKCYVKFQNRIEDWKEFKLEEHVTRHKEFMESESIASSPTLKRYVNELVCEQKSLNGRRIQLLKQLMQMKPPASTKPAVYQWNQAVTNITGQLDQVHSKYTSSIKIEQEKILYECEVFMEEIKRDLFNQGIADEEFIEELFNEKFRPVVGGRKSEFEYNMDRLMNQLQEVMAHQKQHLKHLFRYAHGAAAVWDNHEVGLVKEERLLQELLDKNRKDHDYQNQMKEAKLDIVIDRMRQGSNEESLAAGLKQALNMMEDIKKGYLDFHCTQKTTCEKYPKMVRDEVERYTAALAAYLNVVRDTMKEEGREILKTMVLTNGCEYHLLAPLDEPSSASSSICRSHCIATKNQLDQDIELEVMPYVESFSIPEELFDELKHKMCVEFLEHLEMWNEDVLIRANAVVAAKVEEINNELDLRLHLHEPRPGRAENDVHHIRTTELSLHRERVLQHCTGVECELDKLKKSFHKMIEEHSKENEMFKSSVEELELKFIEAGSTHDLKVHQDEVHGKLDQYMDVIRASVRRFRYDLDNMLNKLRNSNAEFRRSIKIFSEGGNFSPEEIDEYRRSLEKVAGKIDGVEGLLVGELEGMETKRMEMAKEYAGKLEDRFKQHLFDLAFVEKIKRWFTNIQVKIKAEVANSNSQSQHLSKMISVFSRRVDIISKPSVDNENYSAEELHETLLPLITSSHERMTYLNCAVSKDAYNSTAMTDDRSKSESPRDTPKNTPKNSKRKRYVKKGSPSAGQRNSSSLRGDKQSVVSTSPPSERKDRKDIRSRESRDVGKDQSTFAELELSRGSSTSMSTSTNKDKSQRTQFGGKYDKRYLVFGENTGETEPEPYFIPLQLRIVQSGLDGLLSTAELYYRQKGPRLATRAQLINDTFDACADTLTKRLRKYKEQTETFHNESIQEFRAQIRLFVGCVEQLPRHLLFHLVARTEEKWDEKTREIRIVYERQQWRIEKQKKEHQTLLRPTLGHPNNREPFHELSQAELSRQNEASEMISRYFSLMSEAEMLTAEEFMYELQDCVVLLMNQFDSLVTPDDVVEGVPQVKPISEKEMIRNKLIGMVKEKDLDNTSVEQVSIVWPGVSVDCISTNEELAEKAEQVLQSITSLKSTLCHQAVIKARNASFESYCKRVVADEKQLSSLCEKARGDEKRWIDNWNKSLEKIVKLY